MTLKAFSLFQQTKLAVLSLVGFLVSVSFPLAAGHPETEKPYFVGSQSCQSCHQQIYDTYVQTAHYKTSQTANEDSIKGSFAPGRNILRTRDPNVYFKMDRREGGFYQTAYRNAESAIGSRREQFDLVIGSGRKGQSYLYWKEGLLYQLPVSYLAKADRWVNSPGMIDGQILFDRLISPRCLECHTTLFQAELRGGEVRYSKRYLLGLSCEKCHGPASAHVAFHKENSQETSGKHILNPEQFPRERKLDQCALCHSGAGKSTKPPFSYRPGEPLSEYLETATVRRDARPDVHANQVGLLRLSRCFAATSDMTCSTCHDVHKQERNLSRLGRKCMQCHQPQNCGVVKELGSPAEDQCVACHMPDQKSRVITIEYDAEGFAQRYRSHMIAIYPEETQRVLNRLQGR